MSMRTQIFLFLFFFGLAPMLSVVALNLPLVQSKLEGAVRDFQVQALSSEFVDLGQHIATRQEMVQFLAKVPDPEVLLENGYDRAEHQSELMWFLDWVNRMLRRGQDVIEVLFLDKNGEIKLVLERENVGLPLVRGKTERPPLNPIYFNTAMALPVDLSYVGPIKVGDASILTMNMASAIANDNDEKTGVVMIKINVAGMPQRFKNTVWVYNDGRYLQEPMTPPRDTTAFEDFPGLASVFEKVDKGIWQGAHGQQMIWLPLFPTESQGPIWVGRKVDPSEIETFRHELQKRVLVIIAVMFLIVVLVARWLAYRIEHISDDLTNGIARVVSNERVVFDWRGSEEIRQLGLDLTQLADIHSRAQDVLAKRAQELEQSNRYKSQFLANMSHELRTPLNSIILLSKILGQSDQNLTPEQLKHAGVINNAGNDLLVLINDILDIAKIEANKTTLVVSRVHPQAVLTALVDLFEPLCVDKNLQFEVQVAENLPAFETDVDKLQQILKNLLANAIKFTSAGGIRVCVEQIEYDKRGDRCGCICFRVKDSGIGIPKSKHRVIFNAFEQADGSTSRKFGGTGLGLNISKKIAKLLGGSIELDSEVGKGAQFSVCLPIYFDASKMDDDLVTFQPDDLVEAVEETKKVSDEQEITVDLFHKKRILLIDADLRNMLTLTPRLEKWGFQVMGASDGEEARETMGSDAVCDLVLIDILDEGIEIVQWIRDHAEFRDIPIVVLTHPLQAERKSACDTLAVDGFLTKPVDFAQLKQALLKVFAH